MERLTYKDECGYHLKPEFEDADTVEIVGRYEDTGLEPAEMPTGLELANVYASMLLLKQYQSVGTGSEFCALKEAEQKRREGCKWCHSCYSCDERGFCPFEDEMSIEECDHYEPRDPFCRHCGRDLRGESHD